MTTYLKASLLVLLLVLALAAAQPAGQAGVIVGQVFDADLNVPIEYANVVLQRESDSVLVTGTVTRADGRFTLADVPAGRYRVEVSFIGYRSVRKDGVEVAAGARVELGRTALRQTAVAMPGVEATAERPALTYKID